MLIAIPVIDGNLSLHFGHCDEFAIAKIDEKNKSIINIENHKAPPHEPGLLPRWLAEKNVDLIIAAGMGQRAQILFKNAGIEVKVGADAGNVEDIINAYLDDSLKTGENICDH